MGDQDLEIIKNVHNNRRGGRRVAWLRGRLFSARERSYLRVIAAQASIISVLIKRGYVGVVVRTSVDRRSTVFCQLSLPLPQPPRGRRVLMLSRWRLLSPVEDEKRRRRPVAKPLAAIARRVAHRFRGHRSLRPPVLLRLLLDFAGIGTIDDRLPFYRL